MSEYSKCEQCGNLKVEDYIGVCNECTAREHRLNCPQCCYGIYGGFHGGDPRLFSPDPECSTGLERAAHREDCKAWDEGHRPTVAVSGYVADAKGKIVAHVFRTAYGLGTYDYICEIHREA